MALYNEQGKWTSDALNICSEIDKALEPILAKTISQGMSHSDFCYMVTSEVEVLILRDRRLKKKVDKNK